MSHPASLEHDTGFGHPERPERIRAVEEELARRQWLGWERREAPRAELARILAVHSRSHVESVEAYARRGAAFDLDTPTSPGSWEAALRAAGGATTLVESLLADGAPCGISALRPPGHHAEPSRAMGFCLFNNIAIAARHALEVCGAGRVLVLDWDVHHGNGTNAIFHSTPEVLFASIHQWPFYPGTGPLSDVGSGDGEGYSINLPVAAGAGRETFLSLVQHVVLPVARRFGPDVVLISAGFDAHRDDPVGGCTLDTASFGDLAREARAFADELGAPVGALLEGGYDLEALAQSVVATMEGLVDGAPPDPEPSGPAVERALALLRRYWPL